MFVCHCRVVSDRTIRAAIAAGARDVDQITAACGAGAGCGGCVPTIEGLIAEAAVAVREPELVMAQQAARRRLAPSPALQPA